MPGKGAFPQGGLGAAKRLLGFVPFGLRVGQGFLGGCQIDQRAAQTTDGFVFGDVVGKQSVTQTGSQLFCLLRGGFCLAQGALLFGSFVELQGCQFAAERLVRALQFLHGKVRFCQLCLQLLQILQLAANGAEIFFQGGDLPRFIVAAPVQLLFQKFGSLGVRGVLLAGGDERGDTPFQPGVLRNGQTGLADEGAAFKYFPTDPQQSFAAVGGGQIGDEIACTGVNGAEVAHRGGRAAGGTHQRQFVAACAAVQAAGHGCAGPGGVAVFVGNEAGLVPFAAVDAVEHGQQESAPGGFSGLVGSLYDIQAVFQLQSLSLELSERGGHAPDQQNDPSLYEWCHIDTYYNMRGRDLHGIFVFTKKLKKAGRCQDEF